MLEREDPFSLAARQIAIDAERVGEPRALERKLARLSSSAHGFLRGSAPLYYELLALRPDLAEGPPGEGWIAGDMHVENVGAYRADDDTVVFDLNDFDDASVGPWRLDVLRLLTSVQLASLSLDVDGPGAIDLARAALTAHIGAAFDDARVVPESCEPIAKLVERCLTRRADDFLRDSTEAVGGTDRLRIKRNKRTLDCPPEIAREVPEAIAGYVGALGDKAPQHAARWLVADTAVRLAGNGSLGRLRLWVLIDDGAGHRFIELKEAATPAPSALLGDAGQDPAERVVTGARALLHRPIFRLAAVPPKSGRPSFYGRRLRPDEDKLALDREELGAAFPELVTIIGGLLGRAHRRGATAPLPERWSPADRDGLIRRAIELSSLHVGAWLAHARLTRGSAPAP